MMNFSSKELHFRGPYRQQNWSFRNTVINYITKTSNEKAWQKLIQTCKYFFAKHPIIVAYTLDLYQIFLVSAGRLEKRIPPNIVSYKLWITKTLRIYGANQKDVSLIIPQIYRCDATKLLLFGQILSHNEFLFLSRNVEVLHLGFGRTVHDNIVGTFVKNEDGTTVPLEKLVKTLVNLKEIWGKIDPSHSCITKNTVKELLEMPHFFQIQKFTLMNIPEVFDIDTFFIYLKKNKYTKFELHFAASISDAYKTRLEAIIDEILQTETPDYTPPFISFNGFAQ